jgi:hypothetical protein
MSPLWPDRLSEPFGPYRQEGNRMAFTFKLELEDGTPADPPKFTSAVPNWRPGHTVQLGRKTLRVIEVRDESDGAVLVVEPT